MAQWCNKVGLAVAVLSTLTAIPDKANAANDCFSYDSCCEQSCDPCSFTGVEVGADFLYWKPCVDELDFVAVESTASFTEDGIPETHTSLRYKDICQGWEPGVRVRIALPDCWCDWTLSGSYTWINLKNSNSLDLLDDEDLTENAALISGSIRSPLLHGSFASVLPEFFAGWEIAKGRLDTTYQTWDALFSYDVVCNRCNILSPFFGVEGLILNQELKAYYLESLDSEINKAVFDWSSDYFGVGLKVGTDYTYNLFDCLKVFARASGSLVVGNDCAESNQAVFLGAASQTINVRSLSYKDDDKFIIVPGYHLQLGVLYESCYCGMDFGIRLGWEFVNWHNVPNHRVFPSDVDVNNALSTSPTVRTLGFQGFLAGGEIRF